MAEKRKKYEKILIGRLDRVDIPELELYNLEAKIDTGAYSCSIHCTDIKEVEQDGEQMVEFYLLDEEHPKYQKNKCRVKEYDHINVKSSSGETESRIAIKTQVRLFKRNYEVDFTLTNRSDMRYPVLLGRKLLQHGFLVDVNQKNLSYKEKRKKG